MIFFRSILNPNTPAVILLTLPALLSFGVYGFYGSTIAASSSGTVFFVSAMISLVAALAWLGTRSRQFVVAPAFGLAILLFLIGALMSWLLAVESSDLLTGSLLEPNTVFGFLGSLAVFVAAVVAAHQIKNLYAFLVLAWLLLSATLIIGVGLHLVGWSGSTWPVFGSVLGLGGVVSFVIIFGTYILDTIQVRQLLFWIALPVVLICLVLANELDQFNVVVATTIPLVLLVTLKLMTERRYVPVTTLPVAGILITVALLASHFFVPTSSLIVSGTHVSALPNPSTDFKVLVQPLVRDLGTAFFGFGLSQYEYVYARYSATVTHQIEETAPYYSRGSSGLTTLLAEIGLWGVASLLALFVIAGLALYRQLSIQADTTEYQNNLLAIGLLVLAILLLGLYPPESFIWFLSFACFGVAVVSSGLVRIVQKPVSRSWLLTLAILVIMAGVVVWAMLQHWQSIVAYEQSRWLATEPTQLTEAGFALERALAWYPKGSYYHALAQVNTDQLRLFVRTAETVTDEDRNQFRTFAAIAIANAKTATGFNPENLRYWLTFGEVYQTLNLFGVGDAAFEAEVAYNQAHMVAPHHPDALYARAVHYFLTGEVDKAKKDFRDLLSSSGEYKATWTIFPNLWTEY